MFIQYRSIQSNFWPFLQYEHSLHGLRRQPGQSWQRGLEMETGSETLEISAMVIISAFMGLAFGPTRTSMASVLLGDSDFSTMMTFVNA